MEYEKIILEHLETVNDPKINEALKDGKHSFKKCWGYIMRQARKELDNKSGAVEDAKVFKWARDYYLDDVEPIKDNTEVEESEEESKPIKKENTVNKVVKKDKNEPDKRQMSIFDFME